ncbi:hypothetical protein [Carnobacterium maltaromaticum]|uniref:hypothetical protein n=1 Tax=Carnobacterium maltaromaticum TaxID=2751 RepID=UPI00295F09A6|nr:hypothetical protein [Carnobacterium maltaromaticum]
MAVDDAELLIKINKNKAKRKKLRNMMKTIRTAGLNTKSKKSTVTTLDDFIDDARKKNIKVSGSGYEYVSNFNTKLSSELSKLDEYVEYGNSSIEEIYYFYENLEAQEKIVDGKVSRDVDKYNKDKPIWEWKTKF